MLFRKDLWARIARGQVTVAFRRWRRLGVKVGRPYRTGGGRIEIDSITIVDPASLNDDDARRAGASTAEEIRAELAADESPPGAPGSPPVYRIEFHLLDEPDPRAQLAASADLEDDDVARIDVRLSRLDRASRHGPWTMETLRLIASHPGRRAADLAALAGRDRDPFKIDVRKLKNLGLTLSLEVGYRLSPRGEAYVKAKEIAG